jgi:hypothetical protein
VRRLVVGPKDTAVTIRTRRRFDGAEQLVTLWRTIPLSHAMAMIPKVEEGGGRPNGSRASEAGLLSPIARRDGDESMKGVSFSFEATEDDRHRLLEPTLVAAAEDGAGVEDLRQQEFANGSGEGLSDDDEEDEIEVLRELQQEYFSKRCQIFKERLAADNTMRRLEKSLRALELRKSSIMSERRAAENEEKELRELIRSKEKASNSFAMTAR